MGVGRWHRAHKRPAPRAVEEVISHGELEEVEHEGLDLLWLAGEGGTQEAWISHG